MRLRNCIGLPATAALVGIMAIGGTVAGQDSGIDPEALIGRILAVDAASRSAIKDVIFEADLIGGRQNKNGELEDQERFTKKIYIKYLEDTALYHEEYLEYYKDDELQSPEKCADEGAKRIEKRRKRNTPDISYNMLRPFYPDKRDLYDIEYLGVATEEIGGYVCHHFHVQPKEIAKGLIIGDFYFESESFHLVQIDYSPAKLVKKLMFKLKKLDMTVRYGPTTDGYWLPRQFDIEGKGKVAIFFGVSFSGTEYYRNPVVNSGLEDAIFEEER